MFSCGKGFVDGVGEKQRFNCLWQAWWGWDLYGRYEKYEVHTFNISSKFDKLNEQETVPDHKKRGRWLKTRTPFFFSSQKNDYSLSLEIDQLSQEFVNGGDDLGIRLKAALNSDHIDKLLAHIDI